MGKLFFPQVYLVMAFVFIVGLYVRMFELPDVSGGTTPGVIMLFMGAIGMGVGFIGCALTGKSPADAVSPCYQ